MTNLTALVAEHNESVAMVDSLSLEQMGYKVDGTANLSSALDHAKANVYNLVIADINLGIKGAVDVSSGIQLADTLRSKLDNNQTRLILISGQVENQQLYDQKLKGRKNVEYLPKPYSLLTYLS